MNKKVELPKSRSAYTTKIQLFTISFLLLTILSIAVLSIPFRLGGNSFIIGTLIITVVAILLFSLCIIILRSSWGNTHYYISESSVIVERGAYNHTEDIYRFDFVTSVRIKQSYLGKISNYGDIVINMSNTENELIIKDIDEPSGLLDKVHQKLSENGIKPNAMSN